MSGLIEVPTPDGAMPAHLWLPPSGSGPGILLLQEIFGISPYIQRRAQDLADLGYVVLAPESGGVWVCPGSRRGRGVGGGLRPAPAFGLGARGLRRGPALSTVEGRPEMTRGAGIVGFCFGGGLAYAVAARPRPTCS